MTQTLHTSILVILPGSAVSERAISALSRLSGLDAYQARTKLSARFPMPVAKVATDIVNGEIGSELEEAGVRFFAVDSGSFDAPFEDFIVHRCSFQEGRNVFINRDGEERSIALSEKIYLIELRYREETRTKRIESKRIPLSTRTSDIKSTTEVHKHVATQQVLHLYTYGDVKPVTFIDDEIDYSSLGLGVEQNATWNFLRLKGTLEQVFEVSADRTLVDYAFAAQSAFQGEVVERGNSKRKESQLSSNEDAAKKMSRVLYASWMYRFVQG